MLYKGLGNLQVVVECGQVKGREAIFLGLIDTVPSRHVLKHGPQSSNVAPQCGMMEGTKAVVIGHSDVCSPIKQQIDQVISLLAYCIVEGCVPF